MRLECRYWSGANAGGEFTVQVVKYPCQWLRMSVFYGPVNHPRGQEAVEAMGAGYSKHYRDFAGIRLFRKTSKYSPSGSFNDSPQTLTHHAFR